MVQNLRLAGPCVASMRSPRSEEANDLLEQTEAEVSQALEELRDLDHEIPCLNDVS